MTVVEMNLLFIIKIDNVFPQKKNKKQKKEGHY